MALYASDDVPTNIDKAVNIGLTTISIGKLMSRDEETEKELLRACTDLGFFYLDVRDHPSGRLTAQIDEATAAALAFYDETQENKANYKPAGIQTGSVAGKRDGFEGFLIFEHALRNASRDRPIYGPEVFQKNREHVEATNAQLREMGRVVLDSLSRSLDLQGKANLAAHHRQDEPSTTALGLLKYLPYTPQSDSVGHVSHTDIGSLSMVFSDVGGLQVYHPGKTAWMYIPPKPGHTVCNIGDSVEFMSKNVLRSSLHRVIPHPAEKDKVKLTVVYLMRPETGAVFIGRDGKEWKSVDWHNMKNRLFKEDLESQASNIALTGRLGYGDLWDEKDTMS